MQRIPPYMMRSRFSVEPYQGSNAFGEAYGTPKTVRAYVEPKRVLVRLAEGAEVIPMIRAFCPHNAAIAAQSRVTFGGTLYLVHSASLFPGAYLELLLKP
jgi:hypothetical protein